MRKLLTFVITAVLASLTIIGCPNPDPDDKDTVYLTDTVIKKDTIITKDTIIRLDTIITKDTIIDKDTVIVEDTIIVKDTVIVIDTIGKYYNYFSYIEFPETLMMWSQSAIRYQFSPVPIPSNLRYISLGFFDDDIKGVLPVDHCALYYNNSSAAYILAEEYVSGIFAPSKNDRRFYHMGGFSDYEGDNIEALWITPVSNKKEDIKISLRVFGKEKDDTYNKIILDSGFTISGKHIKHIINPLEVREISKNDSMFTGILDVKNEYKDKWNGGDFSYSTIKKKHFANYKLYGYATNSENERVLLEGDSIPAPIRNLSIKIPEEYRLSGYKLSEVFIKFQYNSGRKDLSNTPYSVEGTTDTLKIQW